jgi:hypothetical protein
MTPLAMQVGPAIVAGRLALRGYGLIPERSLRSLSDGLFRGKAQRPQQVRLEGIRGSAN